MTNRLASELYRGRPFGRVGFLLRKELSNRISVIGNDDACRCFALSFRLNSVDTIKLINVHRESKKHATKLLFISSPNIDRF